LVLQLKGKPGHEGDATEITRLAELCRSTAQTALYSQALENAVWDAEQLQLLQLDPEELDEAAGTAELQEQLIKFCDTLTSGKDMIIPRYPGVSDIKCSAQVWAGEEYDTTAYLFELHDRVMICFQGSKNSTHFKTDIMAGQEYLDVYANNGGGHASWFQPKDPYGTEYVHQGFHQAYIKMHSNIMQWLDLHEHSHLPVMCVGHSMGGGLATMCARYLSEESRYNNSEMLCLITFGSPRVGNRNFRDAIEARVGEAWRCVCENDMIPSLPYEDMSNSVRMVSVLFSCCLCCCIPSSAIKSFGEQHGMYKHVGVEVLLNLDGMIATNPCFVDNQYLRQSKYLCCNTTMWKNHQMRRYMKCLHRWIEEVHPDKSDDLKKLMMEAPKW